MKENLIFYEIRYDLRSNWISKKRREKNVLISVVGFLRHVRYDYFENNLIIDKSWMFVTCFNDIFILEYTHNTPLMEHVISN